MNKYKIGDVVKINPFGDCPTHYCKIERFETKDMSFILPISNKEVKTEMISAMGKWYSKEANCVSGTGFDVLYIQPANEKDLNEAIENYNLKNQDNDLWYAARENYAADYPNGFKEEDFIKEFKRLSTDGKHPWDCKCILHV